LRLEEGGWLLDLVDTLEGLGAGTWDTMQ